MSEPENTENDSSSNEFDFYFSFTKPLVLELPSSEDRTTASAWVRKLEDAEPSQERLNYLKLLLFVLQRGRLCGIFKKQPPSGPLQPFPQGLSVIEMGNLMLNQDDGGGGDARNVPYNIEISNDLREFVASQEIPNFGIQMYYAWALDSPIYEWLAYDEDKIPQYILDKIKNLKDHKGDEKTAECWKKKKAFNTFDSLDSSRGIEVKSPQEIEKSQGRSFHAYMGLIGQMGNFNNKCDDDQDKYQRQEQRRGKQSSKCFPKRAQRGEMDECGAPPVLNSMNRPCLCPYPCHHQDCPEHRQKKAPPPSNQQCSSGSSGFSVRNDFENSPCASAVPNAMNVRRRLAVEMCPETEVSQALPQRCPPSRPRSSAICRPPPQIECPPEDNLGARSNQNLCTCSIPPPPCPCPCPRDNGRKPQSAGSCPSTVKRSQSPNCSPNRTVVRPSQATMRPPGEYLTTFKAPSPYIQRTPATDESPFGGRSGGSPGFSSSGTFDAGCIEPNPCRTEVINRCRTTPVKSQGGPISTNNFNLCNPELNYNSRKRLFNPKGISTPAEVCRNRMPTDYCSTIQSIPPDSPELLSHPLCEKDRPPPPAVDLMGPHLCELNPNESPELMDHPLCNATLPGTSQSPNAMGGRQDCNPQPCQTNYQDCDSDGYPPYSTPCSPSRVQTATYKKPATQPCMSPVHQAPVLSMSQPARQPQACTTKNIYENHPPEMSPILNRLKALKESIAREASRSRQSNRSGRQSDRSGCQSDRTICQPERSACPPEGNICPEERNICPEERNVCPEERNVCPEERDVCPEERDVCPEERNVCPEERNLCPEERNVCPPERNVCPPERNVCPPERNAMSLEKCPPMKFRRDPNRSLPARKIFNTPPDPVMPPSPSPPGTVTKSRPGQVAFEDDGMRQDCGPAPQANVQRNMRFAPNSYYSPQYNAQQECNFRDGYTSLPIAPQNSPQNRFVMNQQDLLQRQQRLEALDQNCPPQPDCEENAAYEEEECDYESSGSIEAMYNTPIVQRSFPFENNDCNTRIQHPYAFDPSKEWYSFP